jgi:antitoxin (DNA-binding transcriptional repressor) of toxin-antitoxin stability system
LKSITATELARNLKRMLDQVEFKRESLSVVRNNQQIARIVPGAARQNALEAMADLFRTLSEDAARGWWAIAVPADRSSNCAIHGVLDRHQHLGRRGARRDSAG